MNSCRVVKNPGQGLAQEQIIPLRWSDQSLMVMLHEAGLYLSAPCGGGGRCGKCRVRLLEGELPPSKRDAEVLSPRALAEGWRLACTAFPKGSLAVELPPSDETLLSEIGFSLKALPYPPTGTAGDVGIAVDLGTTTLGFALVDLFTGETLATHSEVNRQRQYGADVVSRIESACKGELPTLRDIIRGEVSAAVEGLCAAKGLPKTALRRIAVAGNTTMQHMMMGLSCATLGVSPFTPVTLEFLQMPYAELLTGDFPNCEIVMMPGISTYVGADITAGILATGLHRAKNPALLLDVGTNGELALNTGSRLICTSVAAGPAFEGGNIHCGTGSVPGAISGAQYTEKGWSVRTIGGKPPVGICGSGVIEVVWQALGAGLIEKSGRFNKALLQAGAGLRLAKSPSGEDITFTQRDVRELQLGKSAVRTGLDILLEEAGLGCGDIETVYLAGGFGYNINVEAMVGIGMLPAAFGFKIQPVGSASLAGTLCCTCSDEALQDAEAIAKGAEVFLLAENSGFNSRYLGNMDLVSSC